MLTTVDLPALTSAAGCIPNLAFPNRPCFDSINIDVRALLGASLFSVAFLIGVLVDVETFGLRLAFSFPSVSSACVVFLCHPALVYFFSVLQPHFFWSYLGPLLTWCR